MAGWLTNGVQRVAALVVNGVTTSIQAMVNNGTVVTEGPAPAFTQLPATATFSADVPAPSGSQPITVAASVFDIVAEAAGLISNTASSTAGAATLNTVDGVVTTEPLSTAPGSTYTFTLTNSLITASSPAPSVALKKGTSTAGDVQVNSITNGSGSVVAVFQNSGTAAWNGKMLLAFHV
jgi:hypothetical protein